MARIGQLLGVSPERLQVLAGAGEGLAAALNHDVEQGDNECCLGEDWHAVHFVLTGDPWGGRIPLSYTIFGAADLCAEELNDSGPPRFLTPVQVKEVATALAGIDRAKLRKRFEAEKLTRHGIHDYDQLIPADEVSEWASLVETIEDVITFYQTAAQRGQAVVCWVA